VKVKRVRVCVSDSVVRVVRVGTSIDFPLS